MRVRVQVRTEVVYRELSRFEYIKHDILRDWPCS